MLKIEVSTKKKPDGLVSSFLVRLSLKPVHTYTCVIFFCVCHDCGSSGVKIKTNKRVSELNHKRKHTCFLDFTHVFILI